MKEINAVIQPYRLKTLRNAFRRMAGFPGMTVWPAQGRGPHEEDAFRGNPDAELTDFSQKVKIVILAEDAQVEEILRIIHETAHAGRSVRPGDGIVWVTPIEQMRRLSE